MTGSGEEDEEIQRAGSGIPGMDEMIQGGFPRGGVHIISGPPGGGKSLFGMQFLVEGARKGENGIYITLEESEYSIYKAMKGFGIDIHDLEIKGHIVVLDLGKLRNAYSDNIDTIHLLGFKALSKFIRDTLKSKKENSRIVVDSLVSMGLAYDNVQEFRQDMFVFCTYLRESGFTSVLLTESDDETGNRTRYTVEGFVGDSFIALGLENVRGELRRLITIRKMRFTDHDKAQHPFLIGQGGITVKSDTGVF